MKPGFVIGVMFDLEDIFSPKNWKIYSAITINNPDVPGFNGFAFRVSYQSLIPKDVVHTS
jgi:hypothetical protein